MINIEKLQSKDIIQFIKNFSGNPHDLLLRPQLFEGIENKELAIQIEGKRAMTRKCNFLTNYSRFVYPPKVSLEQASSEETARYKSWIAKGNSLLDLTGGMGIDMMCMGVKFKHLVYVEPDPLLCELAGHNIPLVIDKKVDICNQLASEYLTALPADAHFDWIYIDPSRRKNGDRLTQLEDLYPNVLHLLPLLQKHGTNIMIKLSPMQHLSECWDKLKRLSEIHLISSNRELKEVLLLFTEETEQKIICAVHHNGALDVFDFDRQFSKDIAYSLPLDYLYIPDPSLMKGDVHRAYAHEHMLSKIHPNTHVYTSSEIIPNYPGRIYKIESINALKKKIFSTKISSKRANAITRNFPLKAKDILKKIGFVEGGSDYLIAFTDIQERKVIAHCSKI